MSFLFVLALISVTPASAAPVLPFAVTFDNQLRADLNSVFQPHLQTAFIMVNRYPPRNFNYSVKGQKGGFKTITLNFVGPSSWPTGSLTQDLQAVTSTHGPPWFSEIRINLLLEPILFESSGALRTDGYIHLTVALAAQIFGPVKLLWEQSRNQSDLESWADMQKQSHRAGVNFIRRVLARPDPMRPLVVTESLRTILARERKMMRRWQRWDTSCERAFDAKAI